MYWVDLEWVKTVAGEVPSFMDPGSLYNSDHAWIQFDITQIYHGNEDLSNSSLEWGSICDMFSLFSRRLHDIQDGRAVSIEQWFVFCIKSFGMLCTLVNF